MKRLKSQSKYGKKYNDRHLYEIWSLFNLLFARLKPSDISPVCIHNRLLLLIRDSKVFFLVLELDNETDIFESLYCSCSGDKRATAINEMLTIINEDYKKSKNDSSFDFSERYPTIPDEKNMRGSKTILCLGVHDGDDYYLLNENHDQNKLLRKFLRFIDNFESDKNIILDGICSVFRSYGHGKNTRKREFLDPLSYLEREQKGLVLSDDEVNSLLNPIKKSLNNIYEDLSSSPIFTSKKVNKDGVKEEIPYKNIFFYFKTATNMKLRGGDKKIQYDYEIRRIIPKEQAVEIDGYFEGQGFKKCRNYVFKEELYQCSILSKECGSSTPCMLDISIGEHDKHGLENQSLSSILNTPFKDGYSFTDEVFSTGGITFDYYDDDKGGHLLEVEKDEGSDNNKVKERLRLDLNRCVLHQLKKSGETFPALTVIPISIGGCPYGAISFVANSMRPGRSVASLEKDVSDQMFLDTVSSYRIVRTYIVKQLDRDIRRAYFNKIAEIFGDFLRKKEYLGNKTVFSGGEIELFCRELNDQFYKVAMVYPYDYIKLAVVYSPDDSNVDASLCLYLNPHDRLLVDLVPSKLFIKLTDKSYINKYGIVNKMRATLREVVEENKKKQAENDSDIHERFF